MLWFPCHVSGKLPDILSEIIHRTSEGDIAEQPDRPSDDAVFGIWIFFQLNANVVLLCEFLDGIRVECDILGTLGNNQESNSSRTRQAKPRMLAHIIFPVSQSPHGVNNLPNVVPHLMANALHLLANLICLLGLHFSADRELVGVLFARRPGFRECLRYRFHHTLTESACEVSFLGVVFREQKGGSHSNA